MYFGNIEAMSIPPEMALPAMLMPNWAIRKANAAVVSLDLLFPLKVGESHTGKEDGSAGTGSTFLLNSPKERVRLPEKSSVRVKLGSDRRADDTDHPANMSAHPHRYIYLGRFRTDVVMTPRMGTMTTCEMI